MRTMPHGREVVTRSSLRYLSMQTILRFCDLTSSLQISLMHPFKFKWHFKIPQSLVYEFIIVFENVMMSNTTKILMIKPKHSPLGKKALFIYSFSGYIVDVGPVLASEHSGVAQCKYEFTAVIY